MKVAIIGSSKYENKLKIKKFIFALKERFDTDLEIVTGGNTKGTDFYVKKYAKQFNISYKLFLPYHNKWEQNCIDLPYMLNKGYNSKFFFINNNRIYKYSDIIVMFKYKDDNSVEYNDIINKKNNKKKTLVIN